MLISKRRILRLHCWVLSLTTLHKYALIFPSYFFFFFVLRFSITNHLKISKFYYSIFVCTTSFRSPFLWHHSWGWGESFLGVHTFAVIWAPWTTLPMLLIFGKYYFSIIRSEVYLSHFFSVSTLYELSGAFYWQIYLLMFMSSGQKVKCKLFSYSTRAS